MGENEKVTLRSRIVGIYYAQSEAFLKNLSPKTELDLLHEPENTYDPQAIGVWYHSHRLGYLPKGEQGGQIFHALQHSMEVLCMLTSFTPKTVTPDLEVIQPQALVEIQINVDSAPKKWMEALKHEGKYCFVPGEITARREKAVAFLVLGKAQIWVPTSQVHQLSQADDHGLWISIWLIEKKLGEIFSVPDINSVAK